MPFRARESAELQQDNAYIPAGHFGAECPSVYYQRLLRDGWVLEVRSDPAPVPHCTVFAKDLRCGWVLRKFAYAAVQHPEGAGVYWDEHEIQNIERKVLVAMPRCEWADRDGATLVWAEGGLLYRSAIDETGLANRRTLFDFNPMKFQAWVPRIKGPVGPWQESSYIGRRSCLIRTARFETYAENTSAAIHAHAAASHPEPFDPSDWIYELKTTGYVGSAISVRASCN